MTPIKQGEVDNLCGCYVIVNSVRFLWPELADEGDLLFLDLMEAVGRKMPHVLVDGVETAELETLLTVASGFVARRLPGRLQFTRPWKAAKTAPGWLSRVAAMVGRESRATAILGLWKPEHWTVLAGLVAPGTVRLLDSSNLPETAPVAAFGKLREDTEYTVSPTHSFLIQRVS